jgi:hypothetical protein
MKQAFGSSKVRRSDRAYECGSGPEQVSVKSRCSLEDRWLPGHVADEISGHGSRVREWEISVQGETDFNPMSIGAVSR